MRVCLSLAVVSYPLGTVDFLGCSDGECDAAAAEEVGGGVVVGAEVEVDVGAWKERMLVGTL